MGKGIESVVAVITLVIGVAIIAVLVSKNSQTASVLTAAGQSFGSILGTALSPVTGGNTLGSLTPTSFNTWNSLTGGIN